MHREHGDTIISFDAAIHKFRNGVTTSLDHLRFFFSLIHNFLSPDSNYTLLYGDL